MTHARATRTVLLDFESRSRADLKKIGGRLYWEHPTTEVLCCVMYCVQTGEIETWRWDQDRAFNGFPRLLRNATAIAAHNLMGFDVHALRWLAWLTDECRVRLIDSSELCRRAGFPGSLEALGDRLGFPKDLESSKFTKGLSRPSRAKATFGQLPALTPAVMDRVVKYCALDVEILAHAWPDLAPWVDLEPDVEAVDRAINDRGIAFDSDLAQALLRADARLTECAIVKAADVLAMPPAQVAAIARSPKQFCEFTGAPNAQKGTIAGILADALEDPRAVALATVRDALASIARGKLEAGLARVSSDGRMRDTQRYYGAHTGRFSGKGMQLQNMPRPAKRFEEWGDEHICALADRVIAGEHHADAEEIDLLLRATLTAAPGNALAVCDFSGVEARALAWVAGDEEALAVFASGRDPYKVMAAKIFGTPYEAIGKGVERTVGKAAELACGYGMGGDKFNASAAAAGVDLSAIGVDPYEVVAAWRELHKPIVQFWYALERAFAAAIDGRETTLGAADQLTVMPASGDDDAIAIVLPSGRPVVYNGARRVAGRGNRPALQYQGHYGPAHVYGGLLAENAIQALCRDLMTEAMIRVERDVAPVVLTVHDEIVCEAPEATIEKTYGALKAAMLKLSPWAAGFPIGASGHYGKRYRK